MNTKCVTGAPGAGKSTYVKEHCGENDIIFDYDDFACALTGKEPHSELTDGQAHAVNKLRYDVIRACDDSIETLWMIASKPSEQLIEALGEDCEYINLDVTEDEAKERIDNDDSRTDKDSEHKKVDRFFERGMKMEKETRLFNFEIRAERNEKHGDYITGRAIVYGQMIDMGEWYEVIEQGALDHTNMKDVRLLINHNLDMIPVARSRNNTENSTMQLMPVEEGLDMRANIDTENNADARSLYSAVGRGDMSGMSFMFTVDGEEWTGLDSDKPVRHIRSIAQIWELSCCTFPAYDATSLEARSKNATATALENARATLDSERRKAEALKVARAKFYELEVQ